MLGISFFEFIIILIVIILAFRPNDIPSLIKDAYKIFYKIKNFLHKIKIELEKFNKSLGINEIEEDLNKRQREVKKIIDIYGKEHEVLNISELRNDMKKEEIDSEIKKENKKNLENYQ
jgi:Sec-independent protein translocase protein TatA